MDDTPSKIGRYEIVEFLGKVGCGQVYSAIDPVLADMPVYIKMLCEEHLRDVFEAKVREFAAIKHPHIMHVLNMGEYEGRLYFITQRYESLDNIMVREHISPMDAVMLGRDMFRGLAHLHKNRLVHGYICPRNICCMENKERFQYYLLDNILQSLTPGYEEPFQESRWYFAPETVSQKPSDRSDVYLAGCLVYTVLKKQFPVRKWDRLDETHGITAELNDLVHRALQLNPKRRPAARELRNLFFKEFERYKDDRIEHDTSVNGENSRSVSKTLSRT